MLCFLTLNLYLYIIYTLFSLKNNIFYFKIKKLNNSIYPSQTKFIGEKIYSIQKYQT